MKTRKITESQLREMIKESLEESIVEIGEDDERSKLSRLGSKRTPEQTKRYKQLLESKLRRLHEEVGEEKESGLKGKAAFIAAKFGEGSPLGKALEDAGKQNIAQRAELLANVAEALSIDTPVELGAVISKIKAAIKELQAEASKEKGMDLSK
jgi:hypothetical protein